MKKFSTNENKKELFWLFSHVKKNIFQIILITLLGIISSFMGIATAVISKNFIDSFTSRNLKIFLPLAFAIAILTILATVISAFTTIYSTKTNLKITMKLKHSLFSKLLASDWYKSSMYHSGDLMSRLTRDAANTVSGVIDIIPSTVVQAISLVISFGVLLYFSPSAALFTLVTVPILVLFSHSITKKSRKYTMECHKLYGKNHSFIQETLQNLTVIKTFSLSSMFKEKYSSLQEDYYSASLTQTKFSTYTKIIMNTIYQIITILIFTWCAYMLYSEKISSFGVLVMIIQLVSKVQAPLVAVASIIPTAMNSMTSAGRIIELLELENESSKDKENVKLLEKSKNCPEVIIENLCYSYDKKQPVLENVSLLIKPKEKLAICGFSGQGKTTLIRILLGLVSSDSGKAILKDGEIEAEISADTRGFFSYVPQGNSIFSGTIRDNLLFGNPDASEQEINEALKAASAYDFVYGQKCGLDTLIGEKGVGLSEGQAQRIAIARAILHKAKILILDEATSSLDPDTEKAVLENLIKNTADITIIVITHRKSAAEFCDRTFTIPPVLSKNRL